MSPSKVGQLFDAAFARQGPASGDDSDGLADGPRIPYSAFIDILRERQQHVKTELDVALSNQASSLVSTGSWSPTSPSLRAAASSSFQPAVGPSEQQQMKTTSPFRSRRFGAETELEVLKKMYSDDPYAAATALPSVADGNYSLSRLDTVLPPGGGGGSGGDIGSGGVKPAAATVSFSQSPSTASLLSASGMPEQPANKQPPVNDLYRTLVAAAGPPVGRGKDGSLGLGSTTSGADGDPMYSPPASLSTTQALMDTTFSDAWRKDVEATLSVSPIRGSHGDQQPQSGVSDTAEAPLATATRMTGQMRNDPRTRQIFSEAGKLLLSGQPLPPPQHNLQHSLQQQQQQHGRQHGQHGQQTRPRDAIDQYRAQGGTSPPMVSEYARTFGEGADARRLRDLSAALNKRRDDNHFHFHG